MGVDAGTSKTQLRARIRSDRAARIRSGCGAGAESSVAESTWTLVEDLWPESDLSGHSMLAYAALAGEPDLDPVIDRFLARGGTVYLPAVTEVGHALMFGTVTESMASLPSHGKWGIREPSPSLTASDLFAAEVAPDLVFVPALGFDHSGARLGNGGGFYDRTFGPLGEVPLTANEQQGAETRVPDEDVAGDTHTPGDSLIYGVCFSTELNLPGLAAEDWDLRIPEAVTDRGVHTFD